MFFREKKFSPFFFLRVKIKLEKIILTINFIHSTIISHNHPCSLDKICIFTLTSKLIILLLLLIFYNIYSGK